MAEMLKMSSPHNKKQLKLVNRLVGKSVIADRIEGVSSDHLLIAPIAIYLEVADQGTFILGCAGDGTIFVRKEPSSARTSDVNESLLFEGAAGLTNKTVEGVHPLGIFLDILAEDGTILRLMNDCDALRIFVNGEELLLGTDGMLQTSKPPTRET